ncbi:MAG: SAM-dependent methyltransferase [Christensenellales bacterium]
MNLSENGKLLSELRKANGMTQKQLADKLGVQAKTVSKWETGHGFPDVSTISDLANILGVSETTLLSGRLVRNAEQVGNMKKMQFYVCPHCGSFLLGAGEGKVFCCGKPLKPAEVKNADEKHEITILEIEGEYYIELHHEMSKEHYISWVAYVSYDRVLMIKLYPEQDSSVRLPKMYGGKLYCYCNKHGLFVYPKTKGNRHSANKKTNLTALLSAFARAYHYENCKKPVFDDNFAKKLLTDEEYGKIEEFIRRGGDVEKYVNTQLAPIPLARARFCEDSLKTAIITGTAQYVVLGSGLDTFALRNGDIKVSIFEVDKPNIIADKIRRIQQAGLNTHDNVHYVAADLSTDNLEKMLTEQGFDKTKKTFFSCLGLLYYLSKEEIEKLVAKIATVAAEGSSLLFDFADNHFFCCETDRVKELIKMASASGEAMKSCFGYCELEKLLQRYNFYIYEFLSDKDMQDRYFADCSDITAFEHVNYALAVVKP